MAWCRSVRRPSAPADARPLTRAARGLPPAGAAIASSRGLQWELAGTRLAVGGLVSSSNRALGDGVRVETDAPLVWTAELDDAALAAALGGGGSGSGGSGGATGGGTC